MAQIDRKKLKNYLENEIFPVLKVPSDIAEKVASDIHHYYEKAGESITRNLIGIYQGINNFHKFIQSHETLFSPSTPDYRQGLDAIQQMVQALELLDSNPELKATFHKLNMAYYAIE